MREYHETVMKLKKIQLSGFKSFPDPTTVDMSARMVGIVGPNGCGKSNIVDAIRWVMGETSRHIRANTLEDVIFSGTSTRKPLGQASVELFFDNTDSRVGGAYANYAELAVKRIAARNNESKYYINNTRCRRKDIAEIFFGTGLGTHSYAIIEQGMIARIVEARPEEMRAYVEEAAGVSKYKDRRRDTENRIRRTRDNLERVKDIREELDKQLRKLKRQVKDAEKFKEIRLEKSRIEAELLLLKLRDHSRESEKCEKILSDRRVELEHEQAEIRGYETNIERQRALFESTNDQLNGFKEAGYRLDAEIVGIEQDLSNRHKNIEQMRQEEQTVKEIFESNAEAIEKEKTSQQELTQSDAQLGNQIKSLTSQVSELQRQMAEIEAALEQINTLRDQHHSESRESFETLKVEKTRGAMYEEALAELSKNESDVDEQYQALDIQKIETENAECAQRLQECQTLTQNEYTEIQRTVQRLRDLHDRIRTLNIQLNEGRMQIQEIQGKMSSLKVLQEAQLGHDTDAFHAWIEHAGLTRDKLIAETIEVSNGWTNAVETVLGSFLEGVQVGSLEDQLGKLDQFSKGSLVLIAPDSDTDAPSDTLAAVVDGGSGLSSLLRSIKLADDLEQAIIMRRDSLQAHESVVTRDGVWIGKNWIKMHKAGGNEDGVLARRHRIEMLNEQLSEYEKSTAMIQQTLDKTDQEIAEQERLREERQIKHTNLLKESAALESSIAHHEKLLKDRHLRAQELDKVRIEIQQKRQQLMDEHQQSQRQKAKAEEQVSEFTEQHSDIEQQRSDNEAMLAEVKRELEAMQKALHQAEIQKESTRGAYEGAVKQSEQLNKYNQEQSQRLTSLANAMNDLQEPLSEIKSRNADLIKQRFSNNQQLEKVNIQIMDIQKQLDDLAEKRNQSERRIESLRDTAEQARANLQVSTARRSDIKKACRQLDMDMTKAEAGLEEQMTVQEHEGKLQDIQRKLDRMGGINLVALDEFNELSERREFINSQYQDLTSALDILETTIKKIDQETKGRFKQTFEQINMQLQEIFPRLFGGGEAYLEMTERDLLKTGVTVMVKPPGKRLASINLLSGGEKALAAAAVVFSIFELNPSPFCVLDEVDAPLDENNIGRFCETLKSMSERIQFIMITHNKISMEYMDNLMGITMQESGVSRLVSVDMDAAARLASA